MAWHIRAIAYMLSRIKTIAKSANKGKTTNVKVIFRGLCTDASGDRRGAWNGDDSCRVRETVLLDETSVREREATDAENPATERRHRHQRIQAQHRSRVNTGGAASQRSQN